MRRAKWGGSSARLQGRLSGQGHPGWNSLPYLPPGWPRLCPSLLLATVAIRSVLSSQVSHASSSGKARHQDPREWTSNLGASVTSASFLTQGHRLGPLPGAAGTQLQPSLPHQCFSWSDYLSSLFLTPVSARLPRVNTAGINMLTLGPQGRYHPGSVLLR